MPKKSTLAILEEIRQENARRAALTRADLEREYEAVKQGGFDIGDVLEFQADLTGSNQLEYHYELVLEDWKRDRRDQLDMEHSFISRHRAAQDFLFPLLDEKDEFEAVHIAHMIARSFYYISPMEARERLVPYLLRYAEVGSAGLRRLVIIALGWVYAENRLREEMECLCRHLESDEDSLCRAWSASAMMQLYFRDAPPEVIREISLPTFRRILETEANVFALGVSIESLGVIWNKKFRLSQVAVDREDRKTIEKAKKSAIRFLSKL